MSVRPDGAYDGAIVVYDADTGRKVQQFEGRTDVEWLCFIPKGGTPYWPVPPSTYRLGVSHSPQQVFASLCGTRKCRDTWCVYPRWTLGAQLQFRWYLAGLGTENGLSKHLVSIFDGR